jgi:hypothetical protein
MNCFRPAWCTLALSVSLLLSGVSSATTAPYPKSRLITSLTWDLTPITSLRKASGSDLWPATWAADGNLYAAWGDGGGFDGDANNIGRVSLGFARITGTPAVGNAASYSGQNVWGAAPAYALSRATFGGKVGDLISIDGVLYGEGGIWTAQSCSCADPTQKSGVNSRQLTVIWSADLGRTWHIAPWSSPSGPGSSLQYGQDYQGAWDPVHVYFIYQGNVATDPGHIFLRRVLKSSLTADPSTPGHYEYLTRISAEGTPSWSTQASAAVPVFSDSNVPSGTYASASVVYDAALGRYLLSTLHGSFAGQIGFFEAPTPWGPWATIVYYDDWGDFNESAGEGNGLAFPSKWISADGKTLWGVFSGATNGFDSFNLAKAVLTANGDIPQITAPGLETTLEPGQRVTARGSGIDLAWSIETVGEPTSRIASGTGSSITFTVPADIATNTLIRVTLAGRDASLYRDYAISASSVTTAPRVSLEFVSTGRIYKVAAARAGIAAYIDRDYPLTQLSAALTGATIIRAANDDKRVTATKYLQFTLDGPGTVYVCYSALAIHRPAWLNDGTWTLSGEQCGVSDGAARAVYQKNFPGGPISLGGNREAPAGGPGGYSNYVVIIGR